jgi:hypothetical protein
MTVVREPRLVGNRGNGAVAAQELGLHPFDLPASLILPRREVIPAFEGARERRRMETGYRRHLGELECAREVRVNEVARLLEAGARRLPVVARATARRRA